MWPTYVGTIWADEESVHMITLLDGGGDAVTGVAYDDITATYCRPSDTSMQTLVVAAEDWTEIGEGVYALTVDNSVPNEEGQFVLHVSADGCETFRSQAMVQKAPCEVHVCPQYDYSARRLDFVVWAHRDGQMVDDPTSCAVEMVDADTGETVADVSSAIPAETGHFYIKVESLDLDANRNYRIVASVIVNAVEYTSGSAALSLN